MLELECWVSQISAFKDVILDEIEPHSVIISQE